jgi:outer membrane protein OmpA-like peptidoglycan-associated protein
MLYQQNQRVEFKILRGAVKSFTLNDTSLQAGSLMSLNIYYDFAKCNVQNQWHGKLDSLAVFLLKNPSVSIEIGTHSDVRGNAVQSHQLTMCRARNVKEYLVQKGISAARIRENGYGETRPIVPENEIDNVQSVQGQEELHAINRRTEINIINVH